MRSSSSRVRTIRQSSPTPSDVFRGGLGRSLATETGSHDLRVTEKRNLAPKIGNLDAP
ncbi:t126 [Tupaiid betaherpesvirus 1]|uniref:T126 n=1 Tax=Tupaiid herpesvirus 1 (strain 1) TaxID=10397 RepID=Q91TH0_TUHV1|nr:t126 [Tupaiid betaherpesvirus 1]AAK57177.1 t126 [Tupaiid betaherpesvirus 1]